MEGDSDPILEQLVTSVAVIPLLRLWAEFMWQVGIGLQSQDLDVLLH